MIYYMFDPNNGLYLGHGEAPENPEKPGEFMLPFAATFVMPPLCTEHQVVAWRDGHWWLLTTIPAGRVPTWKERWAMAWDMLFGRRIKDPK